MSADRRPHLWCLFDRRKNRVIEGLLFDEARAFVSNLDASELENWYVWKEEWPDWRPVNDIEGLTEMIFRALHVSPPPPPRGTEDLSVASTNVPVSAPARPTMVMPAMVAAAAAPMLPQMPTITPTAEGPKVDTAVSRLTRTSVSFPQAGTGSFSIAGNEFVVRSQKRYKKRMHVTITGPLPEQLFKTFTRDISIGGMYLEDTAPEWVTGYFRVRIAKTNSKQIIELNCGIIEGQPVAERFRLAILPLQSAEDERNLENWIAA